MPNSISISELAQAVRSKRGSASLSAIAERTSVSASTLSRIERGQIPDLTNLEKLAAWLEVEIRAAEHQTDGIPSATDVRRVVEVHLRAARNLPDDTARAVARTVELIMEWELEKIDGEAKNE